MTSPYLDLPTRTLAEARADRHRHPSEVYRLDIERAKRAQARALVNNIAITTPTRGRFNTLVVTGGILAASIAAWALLVWALVTSAYYLLG